jgi:hypothetical protein
MSRRPERAMQAWGHPVRLAQTLVKAAVILALIAATLGGAVALGSTLFESPPRDAAEFAARIEAGSTHAAPAQRRTAAERRYILDVSELCAKRNERVRDLELKVSEADEIAWLRSWRVIQADYAVDFEALAPPRVFREDALRAIALDQSLLDLTADALEARRSGERETYETKMRAAELLDEQSDATMARLEAPVCAAE